jgi:hypothetical protein
MDKENEMFKMLSEENKKVIQEAIEQKVNEARKSLREEVETEVREEFARRYDHDRGLLVEAMDRMLTDSIKSELEEFQMDRKAVSRQREKLDKAVKEAKTHYRSKLKEKVDLLNSFVLKQLSEEMAEFTDDRKAVDAQRVKLAKAVAEAKALYKKKVSEHTAVLQGFVLKQLKEEMDEFTQDRRLLQEQRVKMEKQLREAKIGYNKQLKERTKALESFVLKQLTNEMKEFNEDKKQLVESRVKLVAEGKKKLEESRSAFIKRAATLVEQTIESTLKAEMSQFRDDLKAARENNFGRRIFEAFAAEYMASYLAEGTEIKKLQHEKAGVEQKLAEAISAVKKQQMVLTEAKSRIKKAEDNALRTKVLNECLKPLARDKRVIMEELLADVRTDNLKDAFHKYLPSVLGETAGPRKDGRKKLVENNSIPQRKPVAVTGNRNNRLTEASLNEKTDTATFDAELDQFKMLAGIKMAGI